MNPAKQETLHGRYDDDEQSLIGSAGADLWASAIFDEVVDIASPIMAGSAWDELPPDAPVRTSERYTAVNALLGMGLRSARTVALVLRAGYAPESLGLLRRLFEISGHAQRVAEDETGQYAENWLHGRGRAARPRAAFGAPEDASWWKLLSGQAHGEFGAYANESASLDGRRLVHSVGPKRDLFWDDVVLWLTARSLMRVLAAVLKVHPGVSQDDFLLVARHVMEAEARLESALARKRERA